MKPLCLLLCLWVFNLKSFSQTPIPLKEVRVFPENYAIDIIAKMKIATKKNLSKDFLNFQINIESIKNSLDTIINVNQTGKFQLIASNNKNYKFDMLKGNSYYDKSFFQVYDFDTLLKFGSFSGRLNRLFRLDSYQFFTKFTDYKYQVSIKDNCYFISFISDTYNGDFSVDTLSSNLLHLNFNLVKSLKKSHKGTKVGIPTYLIEKVNILESVNEADITFIQDSYGKISLNNLESRVLWNEFEIFKYEENKANKLKYTDKFRVETFIQMKKI
jgi:hypothetical protein